MASKATTSASTMAPPSRKRRSNETAQPSAPKRRRSGNNPPSPGARVNVAVRVRPLGDREAETSSIIRVVDDRCLVFDPKAEAEPFYFQGQQVCAPGLVKPNKDQTFMFDQVFDDTKDNQYVYEHTTKDMLTTLLEGCNCCVFAYGPTGAGKTHTMLGSEECPGVITLTVGELYRQVEKLRSEGQTCDVAVAYMEVYNEVVRDLLCPNGPTLVVRDDPAKGIKISNLTIHKVKEADALFELLLKGSKNRTQHATDANAVSSRSHAIFQVYVTQTENVTSTSKGIRVSKMSFIDLAGSERAAAINRNVKERIREGSKINLSLLALGNCIDALSKSGPHRVPYRGSKLTHILKDSLGGTCRTLMIAAVAPSRASYTDTHNTLKYAERAMKIELQAKKNVLNVNVHMTMYTALIDEYKQKVEGLQRKLDKVETEKTALEAEVQQLKDGLAAVTASRDALLQARETGGGGCPETYKDVLSTTPVLSPSAEIGRPSDSTMKYYVDAVQKIYRVRAKIIGQIWENEAVIRTSQVKENWKQQVTKTVKLLQGCSEDTMKESERLHNFLQSQAAVRRDAKEKLEALHNERRRNFEFGEDLLAEASAAGCLEAVEAEIAVLEPLVEQAETQGQQQMFAQLAELLGQKCNHWESLNSVAIPHLRSLYVILEARNCCSTDQRDAHAAVVKKAKGPGVKWADEQEEATDGPLDLASLLQAPCWRLGTTVRRKSAALPSGNLEEAFEDYTGDATFVRFPNGSPHPRRHRRSGSADMAVASATPSWSSMEMGTANDTFVSDTPRLRVFQPITSPQPSTSKTVSRPFPKYRPSGVHKENSAPRGNFAALRSSIRSNPRPMGSRMRKSLSTSSLPRSMPAATPTSRAALLLSNRGQQQSASRYRQPQNRPNQ
ncbi:uncharacterized protein [Dermacentor andersoni]|uniref:uncharacterized protein n=1 Tax=Dermacentor andersoni TaxID=34620 RepID=UPI002155A324|nr:kinesin-like protein KIF18B [Dermacentor andersoni]